jgi:hypothetical protein
LLKVVKVIITQISFLALHGSGKANRQ